MTKHEVMVSYVQDKIKELCDSILTFNFADGKATSVSFLTNYAGKIVKKYVRAADKWLYHTSDMVLLGRNG